MSIVSLKAHRMKAIILGALGVVAFIFSLFTSENNLPLLLSGLVAFSSMSFFCFTEAFLFSSTERTKLNIWAARLYFVLSIPVVIGILLAIVKIG